MKTIGLKENILQLRKDKKTYIEITKSLGCSKSTVSYYCKEYSLKDIDINLDYEKIKNFFKSGNSIKETLDKFKITKAKFSKIVGKTKILKCENCGKELEVSIFCSNKMCSDDCRLEYRRKNLKNNNYNYENLVKWRNDKKIKSIEYKGGKCQLCGYNKCKNSLSFHHLDPSQKDFSISSVNWKFDRIKEELDKCILVCMNCHGEIHDGLHQEILKK